MKSLVRGMLATAIALVLTGTVGVAVSHVFGQSREYDSIVPPSPSAAPSFAVPPSPSGLSPATVGTPPPAIASPAKPSAINSPPYGYSRFRPVQTPSRQPIGTTHKNSGPIRQVSAESNSQDSNSSGVQQADASSWTGLAVKQPASGQAAKKGGVTPVGHFDSLHDPNLDPSLGPPPDNAGRGAPFNRQPPPMLGTGSAFPTDRTTPPAIRGSHLGLLPGETATERSMRLISAVAEMERQLESMGQRNIELNDVVRQRDDQLLLAIREIKSVRKDVATAKDELERLREQVKNLQEKVLASERDNTALLQTMAPLLYQLLNADATSAGKSEE